MHSARRAGNNKLICSQREFRPEGPFSLPPLNCPALSRGASLTPEKGEGPREEESASHP